MRMRRPPAWILAAAFSVFAYFGLLVASDLRTPGATGILVAFGEGGVVVSQVESGSPADRAGIRDGDRLRRWNGRPLAAQGDWMARTLNRRSRSTDLVEIQRGEATLTLPLDRGRELAGTRRVLLSVRAVQLVTLLIAVFIASRRPTDLVALLGAWTLAAMAVFSVRLPEGLAIHWRELPVALGWVLWFPFFSTLLLPALLFTFFCAFPRSLGWSPTVRVVACVPMVLVALPFAALVWQAVYRPTAPTGLDPELPALLGVGAIYVTAAVAALTVQYARLRDRTDRRRALVLLAGLATGCLFGVPMMLSYWLAGSRRPVFATPAGIAGVFLLLAIPLSFWYAILRHRLFDLRVIVRQSVRYALARRLVLGLVPALGLLFVLDLLSHRDQPMAAVVGARSWMYAALGVAAITVHLRRERWLETLDRRFFRERYDARRLLGGIVQQLSEWESLYGVGQEVVSRIEQALHPEFAAVLVCDAPQRAYRVLAIAPPESRPILMRSDSKIIGVLHVLGGPVELTDTGWLAGQLPAQELAALRAARIDLLVPASNRRERDALLALGPKRSEEPYSAEDRELLAAVAAAVALLVDRESPPAPVEATYAECDACGRCFDAGVKVCSEDLTPLTYVKGPRHLVERYRLDRRLGEGGMGTVYAAVDTELDRPVAAKLIREELLKNADIAERFRREARVAAGFAHPHVVTVYDFGLLDGARGYLIMELLDGLTLRELLKQTGRIEPARALGILRGICAALDEAHRRQLVHRDVKPENIFIVRPGPSEIAKLLDFGIARLVSGTTTGRGARTAPGVVLGTLRYMAPERLRGDEIHPASDLWSLAVVAHEMLTGVHPFNGDVTGEWLRWVGRRDAEKASVDELPAAWREFFDRALSLEPLGRPPTADAFFIELEAAVAAE